MHTYEHRVFIHTCGLRVFMLMYMNTATCARYTAAPFFFHLYIYIYIFYTQTPVHRHPDNTHTHTHTHPHTQVPSHVHNTYMLCCTHIHNSCPHVHTDTCDKIFKFV
jgi:hypothetical protein